MLNKQILQFCFNRSSVVVEFLEVNAIIKCTCNYVHSLKKTVDEVVESRERSKTVLRKFWVNN